MRLGLRSLRVSTACLRPLLGLLLGALAFAGQAGPAGAFQVDALGPDTAPPVIDGRLDDLAWRDAPAHTRFAQLLPRANAAYADGLRTRVQLVADARSLVVGVRAWSAEPPRVLLSRRDAVQRDQDIIGVWIDTAGRGESALFVKASLAGVVTDGLYRAADDEEDLGPDFPVEVAAVRLPDGYSMEIRWPLSALRYPYQATAPWRLVVARAVPAAGDLLLVSGAADGEAIDFLHAALPLDGLAPVLATHRDRAELQATVEWTGRLLSGDGGTQRRGSLGLEGVWRPRADWLVNATLNPDFAQVDIDAPQASGNRALALVLPEKRRYFLESADVLGLPVAAFYSRTVADPRWGLRATWRGAAADATVLAAEDRAGTLVTRGRPWGTEEWTLPEPSQAQLARGRWQSGSDTHTLTQGLLLAQRGLGAGRSNQLVGLDGLWRQRREGRNLQLQWNLMASEHSLAVDEAGEVLRSRGPTRRGHQAWAKLLYSDDDWFNLAEASHVAPEFVNLLGFVDQAGLWRVRGELNRRLGERALPVGGPVLHQTELHLGVAEYRSLRDVRQGEPGGEVIRRELRLGGWLAAARRTGAWAHLGADQQRARSGGRLHPVPALHGGFESTPMPWLARLTGEGAWGRQLDAERDRTGRGGWWSLQASTRWALPGGRSLEIDPVFTGARIAAQGPHPRVADRGLRLLALWHLDAQRSLRLIVQDERSRVGASALAAAEANARRHRSLMWRQRWQPRAGGEHQLAVGASWDARSDTPSRRELFLKWQLGLDGG